jgi:hypothetical protein
VATVSIPSGTTGSNREVEDLRALSGDGKPDIAVGAPLQDVAGADRFTGGTVWVMNGATGKAIQRLDIPSPQYDSRYAERVVFGGCLEPARSDRL